MIIGSWVHRPRRTTFVAHTLAPVALTQVVGPASSAQAATQGPCDIYASGGTPCAAAHSTTRALYGAYSYTVYVVGNGGSNAWDYTTSWAQDTNWLSASP
jgi:non-reducing end alpha-L-arabinofuranosidase